MEDPMNSNNVSLVVESEDSSSNYSAIFEDDGRVAYAYLLHDGNIIADVWLYNHGSPPPKPEWPDPSKMPFANPKEYASDIEVAPIINEGDVQFLWHWDDTDQLREVEIELRGQIYGRLAP